MSYDLAVWEGPLPVSDEEALQTYVALQERYEDGLDDADEDPDAVLPVSPAIASYVDALLIRWPDITEDGSDLSPWADGPLINNASGSYIYFAMIWSMAEEASSFAAALAHRHGLVCFDPQAECLRID